MKIFLAGAENPQAAKILRELHAPYVLCSYYYLRNRSHEKIRELIQDFRNNGTQEIFLDSGAHTFFSEAGIGFHGYVEEEKRKKKEKIAEKPEQYFQNYKAWLENIGHELFDYYAELDIDRIEGVGLETVKRWRKECKEAGLDKLITVYHPANMTKADLEEMCQNYPFIAFEGALSNPQYQVDLAIPKKYGTKVHGFAMTKLEPMRKFPFYSADSTSWLSGARFGMTYHFNGRDLQQHGKDEKNIRRMLKPKVEAAGINFENFLAEKGFETNMWNALQWMKFGEYINLHSKKYWIEAEESKVQNIVGETKAKKYFVTGENTKPNKPKLPSEPSKSLSVQEKDPRDNLPEKTRGKIMEIRADPTIEERRRKAALIANRGNMHAFKNGNSLHANSFLSCNNCYVADRCPAYQEPTDENPRPICAFTDLFNDTFKADNFDIRNMDTVMDSYNKVVTNLLQRLARANFFEQMDGGMMDKAVVPLYAILVEFMKGQTKAPNTPPGHYTQNNYYGTIEELKKLPPERRAEVASAIRGALRSDSGRAHKGPVPSRKS